MFFIVSFLVVDFFVGVVSFLRGVELIYFYCGLGDLYILNVVEYFIGVVLIFVVVFIFMVMLYECYVVVIKFF